MKPAKKPRAPAADHGPRGAAFAIRPSRIVETAVAGVTRREMDDQHLIDRLWDRAQLNDRQYQAARRVLEMATAAALAEPSVEPAWTTREQSQRPAWQDADDEPTAEDRWHALLRSLPHQTAGLLCALVKGEHPGTFRLATLQSGLDRLADRWFGKRC